MSYLSKQEELEKWQKWKNEDDPEALGDLLDNYEDMRQNYINKSFPKTPLPRHVLEGELINQNIKALKRYDPDKGTKLSTWVRSYQPKVYRTISSHSNIGRIPEHKFRKVGTFQESQDRLEDMLGREPTISELADDLAWPEKEIRSLKESIRDDIPQSLQEFGSQIIKKNEPEMIVDLLKRTSKSPEEELVLEHTFGLGTDSKDNVQEISEAADIPKHKVYEARIKLKDRLKAIQ